MNHAMRHRFAHTVVMHAAKRADEDVVAPLAVARAAAVDALAAAQSAVDALAAGDLPAAQEGRSAAQRAAGEAGRALAAERAEAKNAATTVAGATEETAAKRAKCADGRPVAADGVTGSPLNGRSDAVDGDGDVAMDEADGDAGAGSGEADETVAGEEKKTGEGVEQGNGGLAAEAAARPRPSWVRWVTPLQICCCGWHLIAGMSVPSGSSSFKIPDTWAHDMFGACAAYPV
jgi:hypothetical protein